MSPEATLRGPSAFRYLLPAPIGSFCCRFAPRQNPDKMFQRTVFCIILFGIPLFSFSQEDSLRSASPDSIVLLPMSLATEKHLRAGLSGSREESWGDQSLENYSGSHLATLLEQESGIFVRSYGLGALLPLPSVAAAPARRRCFGTACLCRALCSASWTWPCCHWLLPNWWRYSTEAIAPPGVAELSAVWSASAPGPILKGRPP